MPGNVNRYASRSRSRLAKQNSAVEKPKSEPKIEPEIEDVVEKPAPKVEDPGPQPKQNNPEN